MTIEHARDILNAASLGKGTGHVYTHEEAGVLLRFAEALAGVRQVRPLPVDVARPRIEAPVSSPLRLVVLGRAA